MEKWVEGKSIRPKPIFWVIPGCLVDFSLLQHCRNSLNSTNNIQQWIRQWIQQMTVVKRSTFSLKCLPKMTIFQILAKIDDFLKQDIPQEAKTRKIKNWKKFIVIFIVVVFTFIVVFNMTVVENVFNNKFGYSSSIPWII